MTTKKKEMKASSLRVVLTVIIVILIAGAAGGFYFAQKILTGYAVNVSHTIVDSSATGENVQNLQKTQDELASNQEAQTKVQQLLTTSTTYQTQAISDIDHYAAITGIGSVNYSFSAATPATATSVPSVAGAATIGTGKTLPVSVTVSSPLNYTSLLKFITAVETNLPKMEISSLNLGRSTGSGTNSDQVTTNSLTISVFVK